MTSMDEFWFDNYKVQIGNTHGNWWYKVFDGNDSESEIYEFDLGSDHEAYRQAERWIEDI